MGRNRIWTAERQTELRRLWNDGKSAAELADVFQTSTGAIYVQARQFGLTRRRSARRRATEESRTRGGDCTGQRRFTGVVSSGPRVVLPEYHPAVVKGTPFFPGQVKPAALLERMLISGENSRKLGRIVEKGRWKSFEIFSLTLEERDTCPRSCTEWRSCYGNNLHHSTRITDDGTLERRLWGELASLNARFPAGFVVRLHVLGDFYSVGYVDFWRQALIDFPALKYFRFYGADAAGSDRFRGRQAVPRSTAAVRHPFFGRRARPYVR